VRNLVLLTLLAAALMPGSEARALDCAAYERIADLLAEARDSQSKAKAWRSDGDWKAWESRVRKELDEAGKGKNSDAIAKSMRRSLQREQAGIELNASKGASAGAVPNFPRDRAARKNLDILEKSRPDIYQKFRDWETRVAKEGLEKVRKTSSYHDEPLRRSDGRERSVRLNEKYRVIYEVDERGAIRIIDVNGHDYRVK
jgi:hypothetical protein